ncbi:MAG: DUF2231 domain-containing protein [Syntrophorhabdales bacterium]|jgi:predicted heme/steroid binding protein/uncharacterized membrane protein
MAKELDPNTLSEYDGKEGRPAYVSAGGRIVDVSGSRLWKGGLHMARHAAGRDLTADIAAAPHGVEVLDRYPEVGTLRREEAPKTSEQPALPPLVSGLLARYPFLRRHPHPATVHFPIVFCVSASLFSVLSVLTGNRSFDQTAFYCLIGAVISTPVAIMTGLAAWWVTYMARRMRPVTIKRNLSFGMVCVLAVLCAWRTYVPGVLDDLSGPAILYLVLVIAVGPAALTVAYYGGFLTFPVEKG